MVQTAKLRAFEIDSGCCARSHAKDITKYCELHFIKIYWTMWLQEKTRRKRIVNVKTLRELKLLTWKTRLHMQNVLIRKRISFTHSQTANAAQKVHTATPLWLNRKGTCVRLAIHTILCSARFIWLGVASMQTIWLTFFVA